MKKLLSLLLAVAMCCTLSACGKKEDTTDKSIVYTYHTYATAFGTNWNPHSWETSAESEILDYICTPFVSMSIEDSVNGTYEWTYQAATEINDVTAAHQDLLSKYPVSITGGADPSTVTEGYVYQIKLNPELKWQDGTPINADSYIQSMKYCLDPEMLNYRANLTVTGDYSLAGAQEYYYSKTEGYYVGVGEAGYASVAEALAAGETVYINVADFWGVDDSYTDADGNVCAQYVSITDETVYGESVGDAFSGKDIWDTYGAAYLEVGASYASDCVVYQANPNMGAGFDVVGLVKEDDYTLLWVSKNYISYNYFLYSKAGGSGMWLVYDSLYEAGYDTTGELKTTDYGTSLATTMSYGPYVMASYEADKQMVFKKNPNFYGYTEKDEATGRISGLTPFKVDGKNVEWYQTDAIVIDIMDDDAAKQAFLKGELTIWSPSADDLPNYTLSDQLYQADETYAMSLFMNCGFDNLKTMDESKGNKNSVVLSNDNFRKAFSLSIDRAEWVTATGGYKVLYGAISSLYFYDVFNNPESIYRNTDAAKQAICNVYGVEYGAGKAYATLDDAYASVTGYNLEEAQNLMKKACEEAVAAGYYTAGEEIVIRLAYASGALTTAQQQQIELLNKYINAAAEGSGFGHITLEGVGSVSNPSRYNAVPQGEYAIGYGGWGGAAFDPYTKFQVFMDPDNYTICEGGCYDPTTEKLTLTVDGKPVTMTWQAWSGCMSAGGVYSTATEETKLQILAQLEQAWIEQYYDIYLASSASCSLLSYQCNYYTKDYNIMYGFGGLELMSYNYTDADWASYVQSQGGTLNYE